MLYFIIFPKQAQQFSVFQPNVCFFISIILKVRVVLSSYGFFFLTFSDGWMFRYLEIMSSEELEISQPALDPELSSDIHHRITVRNKLVKVHR